MKPKNRIEARELLAYSMLAVFHPKIPHLTSAFILDDRNEARLYLTRSKKHPIFRGGMQAPWESNQGVLGSNHNSSTTRQTSLRYKRYIYPVMSHDVMG